MTVINKSSTFLKNIQDPNLPLEISYFPETTGWKILFVFIVIFIIKKSYDIYKLWKSNKYRREALQEVKKVDYLDNYEASKRLSKILKVTAAYALPSKKMYSISNKEFIDQINQSYGSILFNEEEYSEWQTQLLKNKKDLQYKNKTIQDLKIIINKWILTHKREEI